MRLQSQIDCTAKHLYNTNTLAGDWGQGSVLVRTITRSWHSWWCDIRWFLPLRLCYTPLHETKRPGKQSKCQILWVRQNPARGLWCCVYCTTNSADVNEAGFLNVRNRTRQRQMHAVLLLFRPLTNIGIQNLGMWVIYNLAKAYSRIQNSLPSRGLGSQQW